MEDFHGGNESVDWSVMKEQLLYKLHNDEWSEYLLDSRIFPSSFLRRVLSDKDRAIIGMMQQQMPTPQICILLNIKEQTLTRRLFDIKRKYRLGADTRVDDLIVLRKAKENERNTKQHKPQQSEEGNDW